jgi:hypothetical protein
LKICKVSIYNCRLATISKLLPQQNLYVIIITEENKQRKALINLQIEKLEITKVAQRKGKILSLREK